MLFGRKKVAMVLAEFLGTAILTAAVLAVSKSNVGIPYFVSFIAGLVVAAGTLAFGSVSGAQLNPAVTIGLWTARRVKTLPALSYIAAQIVGGASAYLLYSYLVGSRLTNISTYNGRVLVAETVGTFIFAMGWAAVVYNKLEGSKAALLIGASFTVGIVVASIASAGLLNPAVALGTHNWAWGTYVLGPILGGVIGFNLYALLFAPTESLMSGWQGDKKKK